MITIAESEIADKLPALLGEPDRYPVVIQRDGVDIGAFISMKDLRELRLASIARMHVISEQAGRRVAQHAEELGITPQELVERLLVEDDAEDD